MALKDPRGVLPGVSQEGDVEEDKAVGVVHLVGKAGCQHPERLHLVGLYQLLLKNLRLLLKLETLGDVVEGDVDNITIGQVYVLGARLKEDLLVRRSGNRDPAGYGDTLLQPPQSLTEGGQRGLISEEPLRGKPQDGLPALPEEIEGGPVDVQEFTVSPVQEKEGGIVLVEDLLASLLGFPYLPLRPVAVEGHFNVDEKLPLLDRLDDVPVGSQGFGPLEGLLVGIGRDEENRHIAFRHKPFAGGNPVDSLLQVDVHEDEIGRTPLALFQSLLPGGEERNRDKTLFQEDLTEIFRHNLLVFNDKHVGESKFFGFRQHLGAPWSPWFSETSDGGS